MQSYLLEQKSDKVDWDIIWRNPNIFYINKPTKGFNNKT